jgi:hypothetical protein
VSLWADVSGLSGFFFSLLLVLSISIPTLFTMGMGSIVNLSDPTLGDVRVDLGRRDIFVPQQFLDDPKVCAAVKHVGRKGMPQEMWRHALLDACRNSRFAHDRIDRS